MFVCRWRKAPPKDELVSEIIYDRDQPPSPEEIPMREALVSFLHIAATEDLPQPTSKAG